MHPDYLSTRYAGTLEVGNSRSILVPVQHHHAHIASCMAENGLAGQVIGVALDGTGYGTDGRVWGGEFLVGGYGGFERRSHFQYVPLPAGDAAIERPYRMAVSYLLTLLGEDVMNDGPAFLKQIEPEELDIIRRQVKQGINSPQTSSCGRLFDAVAAIIGLRSRIDYEAQAAIELEMAADEEVMGIYRFDIIGEDGLDIVHFDKTLSDILDDLARGLPTSAIAMKFHRTMASVIVEMCRRLQANTGINRVALSGGVFQNRLLLKLAVPALRSTGLEVYIHRLVPTNDGGIALGQAAVAGFIHRT
jgi:hydrogenase maturation protein HypF